MPTPFVTIVLASFAGEGISLVSVLGSLLVILGVYLGVLSRKKPDAEAPGSKAPEPQGVEKQGEGEEPSR